MRKFAAVSFLLCLSFSAARAVDAAEGSAATQPTRDSAQIDLLIKQLGSKTFDSREAAQRGLKEIGQPAMNHLGTATRSNDPEIRSRALTILAELYKTQEVCIKELGDAPRPLRDFYPTISPNGEHVAYTIRRDDKQILVYDGKEGPAWDSILHTGAYSQDSSRFVYQATKEDQTYIVFVGEEATAIPMKGNDRAVFSADLKRVAYGVLTATKWNVICDGVEGPRFEKAYPGLFSPDGTSYAYTATDAKSSKFVVLNGQQLQGYEGVGTLVFSSDGKRLAYTATRGDEAMVVCDGKEGTAYPEVFYPIFSPDGKSMAYWARSENRKKYHVILNGKEVAQPSGEPRLAFSPDSRVLACGTYSRGEVYRFGEKTEQLATDCDCSSKVVFSPDSRHVAYTRGKNMKWWVCVDERSMMQKQDPAHVINWDGPAGGGTSMILDAPGFSADGQHVFFKGFHKEAGNTGTGSAMMVCDGFEGPAHQTLWIPTDYANHAKRLRYVVLDEQHVRLMELPMLETMTWQDAVGGEGSEELRK